jgi:hypothetical protein
MKLVSAALLFAVSTGALAQNTSRAIHVGPYIPNSQLLEWCKSRDPADYRGCFMYIEGVINLSGNPAVSGTSGPINIPSGTPPSDPVEAVTDYIQHLDPILLSGPASDSVYSVLKKKYPYRGPVHP